MSTPPFPEMDELLQRLLDDQLEPDEMQRLGKAIREDSQVRDYYIDSLLVSAVIRRSSQVTGELSKSDLIQALSSGVGANNHSPVQGDAKRLVRRFYYSIAAILVLGALVLVSLYLFRHKAQGPALGMLAGAYETQWRGSHPRPGEPLHAGLYDLREGVAKMDLGQGTSLLLEAPCQVELKSVGEVTLRNGRLAAVVPPQAVGFSRANTYGSHYGLGHGIWGDRSFRREHRGPCAERPYQRSPRPPWIGPGNVAHRE